MPELNSGLRELLRETERRRLRSLVERDIDQARSLHADDYQLITPGGQALSRDEYLGEIASGAMTYLVFEAVSEIAVQAFDGAGAVRYQARIEVAFGDRRDSGVFWHTDIYALRDGRWQAVWSHATRTQPLGQAI